MTPETASGTNVERYIPSLDGLRAVSIVLVLYGHLCGCRGFLIPSTLRITCLARYGVQVFFVISGFLITTLLLNEEKISLTKFYIRRFFRILPAFYFYMLVIALAGMGFHWVPLAKADFIKAAIFISNYHNGSSWVVGHIWSLSTEEQFYLVWPCCLLICGKKYGIIPAILMSVFPFIAFCITHVYLPAHDWGLWNIFARGANGIGAGCVLAFVKDKIHVSGLVALLGAGLAPLALWFAYDARLYVLLDCFSTFGIALYVAWAIDHAKTSMVGRFLNLRVVRWLGVISYSLYLWQMPFLNREMTSVWASFPLNLILVFVFACGSYYGIEKYFLKVRKKLVKMPGRKASFALASSC